MTRLRQEKSVTALSDLPLRRPPTWEREGFFTPPLGIQTPFAEFLGARSKVLSQGLQRGERRVCKEAMGSP